MNEEGLPRIQVSLSPARNFCVPHLELVLEIDVDGRKETQSVLVDPDNPRQRLGWCFDRAKAALLQALDRRRRVTTPSQVFRSLFDPR